MSENQLQLIAASIIKYMKLFETLEFKCIPNYQDIQVLETLWLDKWNSNLVTQLDRQFKKPELKKKTSLKSIDLSFGFKKKLNHLKSNLNLMKDTSTLNLLPLDNLSETDRALNTHNEIEPSIPKSCDVKQIIPIKNIPLPAIELPSYNNPIEEEIDTSVNQGSINLKSINSIEKDIDKSDDSSIKSTSIHTHSDHTQLNIQLNQDSVSKTSVSKPFGHHFEFKKTSLKPTKQKLDLELKTEKAMYLAQLYTPAIVKSKNSHHFK
ncbi:hypothetical protein HDV02_002923 [Globomyces sp. JEL0801]|nr:hypothetical protein HDV02_002923 [Globomyces sp. JEL0801]